MTFDSRRPLDCFSYVVYIDRSYQSKNNTPRPPIYDGRINNIKQNIHIINRINNKIFNRSTESSCITQYNISQIQRIILDIE